MQDLLGGMQAAGISMAVKGPAKRLPRSRHLSQEIGSSGILRYTYGLRWEHYCKALPDPQQGAVPC